MQGISECPLFSRHLLLVDILSRLEQGYKTPKCAFQKNRHCIPTSEGANVGLFAHFRQNYLFEQNAITPLFTGVLPHNCPGLSLFHAPNHTDTDIQKKRP